MSDMIFEDNPKSYCSKVLLSLYEGSDVALHFTESNQLLLKKLKDVLASRQDDDTSSILVFIDVPPENKNAIGRYAAIRKYILKNKLTNVMLVPIICIEFCLLSSIKRAGENIDLPDIRSRDRDDYKEFLRIKGKMDSLENFSKFIVQEDSLLCIRNYIIKKGSTSYLEQDCIAKSLSSRSKQEYLLTSLPVWCSISLGLDLPLKNIGVNTVYPDAVKSCYASYKNLGYGNLLD